MASEWKERILKEYGSKYNYLELLYSEVALIHYRCELVREELDIPIYGGLNRRLLAFLIGAIEGFLKTHFASTETSKSELFHLVTITYGYLILKEEIVSNEGEWCAYIARVQDAMDAEHGWYYELGIQSCSETNPEGDTSLWESLKKELQQCRDQLNQDYVIRPANPNERSPRVRCALCPSIIVATNAKKFMNVLICPVCARAKGIC